MYTELIQKAISAREKAYAPYSGFYVGAALETKSGKIFTGCNVENAAYSPTICAERTAAVKAVSEGETEFVRIAIVGDGSVYLPPCGVCRQVLAEFCDPKEMIVILARDEKDYKVLSLEDLFPGGFGKDYL